MNGGDTEAQICALVSQCIDGKATTPFQKDLFTKMAFHIHDMDTNG